MAKRPIKNDSPAPGFGPRAWQWFAIVAAVAFALRLAYLVQARASDPLFLSPGMDALYHHRWALAIGAGTEFIHDAFFRAPLYPYFLALVYKLTGVDLFWTRVVQAVIGSASCGLTYLLARRLLGLRGAGLGPRTREVAARVSGLVMAAYPLAIYFDGELLIPGLLVFLLLLGLVLLMRAWDSDRGWWLPGLVFGLAVITRPNVLAFLAALAVWFFLAFRGRAWKRLGLFFGAVLLVVLPVTVRNYVKSRTIVPVAWQAGTNFYIGNNPEADGVTAILPGTRASWWGGFNDVRRLAEEAAGRPLKGAEIDRYWMSRGFEFWRQHPGKAMGLVARKLWLLASGHEVSNNRDIYFFKRYSFLNPLVFSTGVFKFPFGLLLPLALVGLWFFRRVRRRVPVYLFLAAYGLSFVPFFVTARFRMPLVPLFVIMAAYGVIRLWQDRTRKPVIPIGILAGSLLLFNVNLAGVGRDADPAQNHYTIATGLREQGKLEPALAALQRALACDSASNVLILQSGILRDQGRLEQAKQAALAAVRVEPGSPDPLGALGNVYGAAQQLDSARVCFERVVELDPYSVQAWNNLGNIALGRNEFARARGYYEQALSLDPVFTTALFHLGLVDYYEGNKQLARARWRKVLGLDPTHPTAGRALNQLR